MNSELTLNFTDKVINNIFTHHHDRVINLVNLTEAQKRFVVTSSERFVFPFEHAVILGLYSGEKCDGSIVKSIKKRSCYHAINISYLNHRPMVKPNSVREAIKDVFNVSYGLGKDFHGVDKFRDYNGRISVLNPRQGQTFIQEMTDGLNINVENRSEFAKSTWLTYSSGTQPRLFNF